MQKTNEKEKGKRKRKISVWQWKRWKPVVNWGSCSPLCTVHCSVSVLLLTRLYLLCL
jgi:hypothetical protein